MISPHIMNAIATERIADLRRDAVPRPDASAATGRTRRFKRSVMPTQTAPAVTSPQR